MTKQTLKVQPKLPDGKCFGCALMADHGIFNLCLAKASEYVNNGRQDWHTIQHMRSDGDCGEQARFFKEKGK